MEIILPIQADPFHRIFSYSKHYEFRKKLPLETKKIYLYLSRVGIKGEIAVSRIERLDRDKLIYIANLAESNKGDFLLQYYGNNLTGDVAYIKERREYSDPVQMGFIPQSYVYLHRYTELQKELNNLSEKA